MGPPAARLCQRDRRHRFDQLELAWSAAAGLPVRPDVTQHGGGESWSALVAGVPAILVEIEGSEATPEIVAAQLAGFEAMLAALA